jgi:hypothetical protein
MDAIIMVPLPPAEWLWLKRLELATGTNLAEIVASMLRDIRIDDEEAHGESDGGRRH